ncbi:MAG: hypothetical protein WC960_07110, partial [Bacteroidales bacterium]
MRVRSLIRFSLILLLLTTANTLVAKGVKIRKGEGEFIYRDYKPLADKKVTIFYFVPPKGDIKTMPILFAMHGADRKGDVQIESWRYFAQENNFIVIAPQFAREEYKENDYQFGGITTTRLGSELRPSQEWTYKIIEPIFDFFKKSSGNVSETYDIWGHSAGGQFVHRFLLATPTARVRKAVASNAGNYTFPIPEGLKDANGKVWGWPYSIYGTPFVEREILTSYFAKPLVVHGGDMDTTTTRKDFPKDPPSMAQGAHRYERAQKFYAEAKSLA